MDLLWWDFPLMFTRSKNRAYRERMLRVTEALIEFLNEHQLVVPRTPESSSKITATIAEYLKKHRDEIVVLHLPRVEPVFPQDFQIKDSDLTPEGQLLMRKAFHPWLGSLDRGTPLEKAKILHRELKKIRVRK